MAFQDIYRGQKVLVTGDTGFKGAWLCEWLVGLGAQVAGFALPPATQPSLFDQLGLPARIEHVTGDLRDLDAVCRLVAERRPRFIFHLAAQSLVRPSYEAPVDTYATNVMGTVNIMEAVRRTGTSCVLVAITTDKCYENKEWVFSYREEDPMGGHDPYSSSKGAAELAIAAYRRSFFSAPGCPVRLASARAGNVVGGGDWAADRIVPDCIRALQRGAVIPVRNRTSTRPWQHVLEPLSGYLWLGAQLAAGPTLPSGSTARLASAFNFGPGLHSNRTVADLVQELLKHWPGNWEDRSDPHAPHEAKLLNLATDKAHHLLHWKSVWDFEETVAQTVAWYREAGPSQPETIALTRRQISLYTSAAVSLRLPWAVAT